MTKCVFVAHLQGSCSSCIHIYTNLQKFQVDSFLDVNSKVPCSRDPTGTQARGHPYTCQAIKYKKSTTYNWRYISTTKGAFRGSPLHIYLLKEICFFQGEQIIIVSDAKTSRVTAPAFNTESHSSAHMINRAMKQ